MRGAASTASVRVACELPLCGLLGSFWKYELVLATYLPSDDTLMGILSCWWCHTFRVFLALICPTILLEYALFYSCKILETGKIEKKRNARCCVCSLACTPTRSRRLCSITTSTKQSKRNARGTTLFFPIFLAPCLWNFPPDARRSRPKLRFQTVGASATTSRCKRPSPPCTQTILPSR